MSQGSTRLLTDRRFSGLFWTQFSVAFNDNVFKSGLVFMVTYSDRLFGSELTILGLDKQTLNPVTSLLLIAPFVLFSAIAGQVSDRYPKHLVMRAAKLAEIPIMIAAAAGFGLAALGMPYEGALLLLGLVFFMGLQSAFFGPSKYAVLPQLLPDQADLVAGNAWIELGTYLSVLGGIALATGMIELPGGMWWFSGAVVVIAVLGWWVSWTIPAVPAQNPDLKVAWEPVSSTWDAARVLFKDVPVLQSVLGISWFWALGGAILSLFPSWASGVLYGQPTVYALFMGLFAVGIGAGSIACERLSFGRLEMGLVPIGSAGLFLGLLVLFLIGRPWPAPADGELLGLMDLAVRPMFWVLVVDVLVLAASGGFFMVPLYTLVQDRADPGERSRIIGANNIVNSFFILLLQGGLIGLALAKVTEPVIFGILGAINVGVAIYIYLQVPEFTLRFITWVLSNVLYRVHVTGLQHVPERGPCLVVANHVSFVDFLLVMGALRRPARFVMDRKMSQIPILSVLFRQAQVIPITSFKEDPALVQRAFETVHEELARGRIVVIFPEGGLTWDGAMIPFKAGVERILARDPVPVVPIALNGLWGSFFSRKGGRAMRRPFPRGMRNHVWLTVGEPVPGAAATAAVLQDHVTRLWSARPERP